jgi:hypothetical protein
VPQSFSAIFHYNDNNKEALNSVTKWIIMLIKVFRVTQWIRKC